MSPTDLLLNLADASATTQSPVTTVFITVLGGGLILALVAAYKARAEKGTVVASGAESAVLSLQRSLTAMEARAMFAERRLDEEQVRSLARQARRVLQLTEIRADVEAGHKDRALDLLDQTLADVRGSDPT